MAGHEGNLGVGSLDNLEPEECILALQQMAGEDRVLGHSEAHTVLLGALAIRDKRMGDDDPYKRVLRRITRNASKRRHTYVDTVTIVGADAVEKLVANPMDENVFIIGNHLGSRSPSDQRRVLAVNLQRRTQYMLNPQHGADTIAISRTVEINSQSVMKSTDRFTTVYSHDGNSFPEYTRRTGYVVMEGNHILQRFGASSSHPSVVSSKPRSLELVSFLVLVGLDVDVG
jgi:hypothetical protein